MSEREVWYVGASFVPNLNHSRKHVLFLVNFFHLILLLHLSSHVYNLFFDLLLRNVSHKLSSGFITQSSAFSISQSKLSNIV